MTNALEKAGDIGDIAKAYKVGPKEAAALVCLTQKIDKSVVEAFAIGPRGQSQFSALAAWRPCLSDSIKDAVRKRGMRTFLTHEAISNEIFNTAWTSGTAQYEQWNDVLANQDDNELDTTLVFESSILSFAATFLLYDVV